VHRDDYRDLNANTNANWKIAPAHKLGYDILLRTGHDPFGLVRTEANGGESRTLDRWVDEKYSLDYRLGQPRSSFSLENKASVYNKSYHTNRTVPGGFGTRFLDNDIEAFETTALYHYSPKTHAQLNFVTSHVNFATTSPASRRVTRRNTGCAAVSAGWPPPRHGRFPGRVLHPSLRVPGAA